MGNVLFFLFDEMAEYEITLAAQLLSVNSNHRVLTAAYGQGPVKNRAYMKSLRFMKRISTTLSAFLQNDEPGNNKRLFCTD